jgi:hypothetical protein
MMAAGWDTDKIAVTISWKRLRVRGSAMTHPLQLMSECITRCGQ